MKKFIVIAVGLISTFIALAAEKEINCEAMHIPAYDKEYKACLNVKAAIAKDEAINCEAMHIPAYADEYKACLRVKTATAKVPTLNCEAMDLPAYAEEHNECIKLSIAIAGKGAGVDCINCNFSKVYNKCEVNEQYAICNGDKYIRDPKDSGNLKRSVKEIEDFIDKTQPANSQTK